jgi:hypothetical protein
MIVWGMMDPENGRQRPYASSLPAENRCPIYEYVTELQKKAETKKAELQASGLNEKAIKETLRPLNKIISNIRPKTVFAWNAVDRAGTIGILEIKPTAQQKLKELMATYIRDYNQDPTSISAEQDDSGVWFNINRVGEGFDTVYNVEKVQTAQKINGQMMYCDDRSPLPESIQASWEDSAYDLTSIYQTKTYDELKEILLANMPLILQECADAAVEGFMPTANSLKIAAPTADVRSNNTPAPAAQPKTVAAPVKTNVNLKLDSDTAGQVTPKANYSTVAKATTTVDDDFMKMAEDILNE